MSVGILLEFKLDGLFVPPRMPSQYTLSRFLWGDPAEYDTDDLKYPVREYGREVASVEVNSTSLLIYDDYTAEFTLREDSRIPNINRYTADAHCLISKSTPEDGWYYHFRLTNIKEVTTKPYEDAK